MSLQDKLSLARRFLQPRNATQRQYEALRAYCVEEQTAAQVARLFGYTTASVRALIHQFRENPVRPFFLTPAKGPHAPPKRTQLRAQVIALRKQNLSIYDISRSLHQAGQALSPAAIALILQEEGFAKLPRRADEERPPASRPTVAEVADVQQLDLQPRTIHTRFGGLFLFLSLLATLPFDRLIRQAGFPGSAMIPAPHALRSLLALKLFGNARHSHVMSYVLDDGLALFAGLNVIPKRSFLTEYSCRLDPTCYATLLRRWFDALSQAGLPRGHSFDLDFHTIPFHGNDALVEKHYISKRSRQQKGLLAFLAHDADTQVFCFAQADIRKEEQADAVLQFIAFWKQRTGRVPKELIFDSKLTTYANLNRLDQQHVGFITLRRRSKQLLQLIAATPSSAWRQIELEAVSRLYKTPRILDQKITLNDYDKSSGKSSSRTWAMRNLRSC
jgi:hypothetical protein